MTALVINSAESLSRALGDIREAWNQHKFLRVNVKTGKDRSLDQNSISHTWYEQISCELREDTPLGVKAECKLRMGVPILRSENPEFRAFYDASIKGLSYEQKLKAMEYVPVTSLMTVPQLSKYLGDMQADYGRRGVRLEFPDEVGTQKSRRRA